MLVASIGHTLRAASPTPWRRRTNLAETSSRAASASSRSGSAWRDRVTSRIDAACESPADCTFGATFQDERAGMKPINRCVRDNYESGNQLRTKLNTPAPPINSSAKPNSTLNRDEIPGSDSIKTGLLRTQMEGAVSEEVQNSIKAGLLRTQMEGAVSEEVQDSIKASSTLRSQKGHLSSMVRGICSNLAVDSIGSDQLGGLNRAKAPETETAQLRSARDAAISAQVKSELLRDQAQLHSVRAMESCRVAEAHKHRALRAALEAESQKRVVEEQLHELQQQCDLRTSRKSRTVRRSSVMEKLSQRANSASEGESRDGLEVAEEQITLHLASGKKVAQAEMRCSALKTAHRELEDAQRDMLQLRTELKRCKRRGAGNSGASSSSATRSLHKPGEASPASLERSKGSVLQVDESVQPAGLLRNGAAERLKRMKAAETLLTPDRTAEQSGSATGGLCVHCLLPVQADQRCVRRRAGYLHHGCAVLSSRLTESAELWPLHCGIVDSLQSRISQLQTQAKIPTGSSVAQLHAELVDSALKLDSSNMQVQQLQQQLSTQRSPMERFAKRPPVFDWKSPVGMVWKSPSMSPSKEFDSMMLSQMWRGVNVELSSNPVYNA